MSALSMGPLPVPANISQAAAVRAGMVDRDQARGLPGDRSAHSPLRHHSIIGRNWTLNIIRRRRVVTLPLQRTAAQDREFLRMDSNGARHDKCPCAVLR
jgi:hypothetical protein